MKKIILASNSPTRKKLLTDAGIDFEVDPSNYEEDMTLNLEPAELVTYLSLGKAKEVAPRYKNALILSADTMIFYEHHRLGKPHTPARAKEMLQMLSGKQHSAITGFTIIDTETNNIISRSVETKVFFKNLSEKEIDDYIATGEPLDKAGAYAILERGVALVEKIEGSKTNISGLPMDEVIEILKKESR